MAFPTPIFGAEDWLAVWIFPTIMAIAFGVFMRDRGVVAGGDRRPLIQRFVSNFVLYASVWIPFQIVGDAIERGAAAQGFTSGAAWGWGFGVGLASGVIVFLVLLAVAARVTPVQQWLGYDRNPFKSAGKS